MKTLQLILTCLVALSPIVQAETKRETGDFTFQTVPITEYWKKQGFSQQLTAFKNTKDDSAPGYYFLSDKVADYLTTLSGKTVKLTIQTEFGKEPKVIQVDSLDIAKLPKEAIQKQWTATMTGHVATSSNIDK